MRENLSLSSLPQVVRCADATLLWDLLDILGRFGDSHTQHHMSLERDTDTFEGEGDGGRVSEKCLPAVGELSCLSRGWIALTCRMQS